MDRVESLTCDIELPADWDERPRAMCFSAEEEAALRRYPRYSCSADAALRCRQNLPAFPRRQVWTRIMLQNVSRLGAGFIHSEQLFPDEETLIVLPNGSQRIFRVIRCRRHGPKCFEIGGEFADASEE